MSTRDIGGIGEDAVCRMLTKHGYEIIKRNFTVRGGEIDIIAKKDDLIAFVEVKTRKRDPLTSGEEAITAYKKKHLIYAAQRFLDAQEKQHSARFDVAVAEYDGGRITKIHYYVSAFDASR